MHDFPLLCRFNGLPTQAPINVSPSGTFEWISSYLLESLQGVDGLMSDDGAE